MHPEIEADGSQKIVSMMENLRRNPPRKIGGLNVRAVRDYKSGLKKNLTDGAVSAVNLPESDVLYFELEKEGWCCVRPSGTEPKIKFYFGAKGENSDDAGHTVDRIRENLIKLAAVE